MRTLTTLALLVLLSSFSFISKPMRGWILGPGVPARWTLVNQPGKTLSVDSSGGIGFTPHLRLYAGSILLGETYGYGLSASLQIPYGYSTNSLTALVDGVTYFYPAVYKIEIQ